MSTTEEQDIETTLRLIVAAGIERMEEQANREMDVAMSLALGTAMDKLLLSEAQRECRFESDKAVTDG